jgi:hypothetical protein
VDTIGREVKNSQEEYGELVSDLNTKFGLQANRIEVIDGLYQSVSAGVEEGAEAQREFLETAAQLAVVGRVDLATTVDVLSTVMNTYGMETEQAQDVSESLFQTVQFGKVRMEELAPVLGRVAALGSELDTQIDEIGASMAVLTRTGFDARVAATGLRNIFRAMMRPSETMQQMLREIALENDLFADSMEEGSEAVREIANEYRSATDALAEFEQKQSEARATQEKSSLAIQEARLKIEAIEEERLEQLPEITSEQVKEAESVEELESVIDDYQFKVNKARIQEERYRQNAEETEEKLSTLRQEFKQNINTTGDLEGSIGNLVLGNQDFVETLVDLRKRADEQNVAFNELFPRTRALQGALALVGEDGQALTDIFEQMESGTFDAKEAWEGLDESAKSNFDSFESFKASTEDVQQGDLQQWFDQATGEQVRMRNSLARLKEVAQDLGAVFSAGVTDALTRFADSISRISDFAKNMDESLRSNISRFLILSTVLGLVVGPLLLIAGQMALIAGALGPALIPFLAGAAGLFGLLASSIKTAVDGGEGADNMFSSMSSVLHSIKSALSDAHRAFKALVLPELLNFADVLTSLFYSLKDSIGGVVSDGGGLTTIIFNIADAIGQAITSFSEFIAKNEELIVEGITILVGILSKEVIPNLVDLAAGILQVIAKIDPKPFIALAGVLGFVIVKVVNILGWIGRWLQRNDQLVGKIATLAIMLTGLVGVLGKLAPVFSVLATAFNVMAGILGAYLIPQISALAVGKATLLAIFGKVAAMFPTLSAGFGILATVASKLLVGLKLLAGGFATLAGAISAPVAAVITLIAILGVLVASAFIAKEETIAIFKSLYSDVKEIFGLLGQAIGGEISWKEAGQQIVETLVSGMLTRIQLVKNAAKKVAGTVKDFLGFGSAPEGYGEEMNPKNWGGNAGNSFALGLEGSSGEIDSAVKSTVPSPEDFAINFTEEDLLSNTSSDMGALERSSISLGRDTTPNQNRSKPSGMSGGKKIVIEEGAVEVGPFHGISDEELPERVEEEVDKSLEEIVEEIKGSGHDSVEKL